MFIDKAAEKNFLAPEERNVTFGEQTFAPNGAKIKFLAVVVYKHLTPNGVKTTTSINTDRFVAQTSETLH